MHTDCPVCKGTTRNPPYHFAGGEFVTFTPCKYCSGTGTIYGHGEPGYHPKIDLLGLFSPLVKWIRNLWRSS